MPFAVRDGVQLHWRLEGAPDRPALLLLQPIGADLAVWEAALPALLDPFRILRTDLHGHGASEAAQGSRTAELARDVLAVMDAADVSRAHVAGVGLGGRVALDLAALAPDRVQALALICTPAPVGPSDRPGEVACPTLIVSGRTDAVTPFEAHGSVLARTIPGALTVLIDCGHLPLSEAPAALAAQLRAFFLKPPDVAAAEALLYEVGLANRRRVLGDAYVEGTLARRTPFNAEFQAMITRIAWHEIYSRPGLDLRTRRLIVLAVTAATARWDEFRLHLRAAVTVGDVSRDEIKELLMQLAIYAGVPAANTGFAEAADIFAALDAEGD